MKPKIRKLTKKQLAAVEKARQEYRNRPEVKAMLDAIRDSSRLTGEDYNIRINARPR